MRLHESGEMYLESIWVLRKKKGFVRAIDVCEYLGYSKPSVSRAVALLKENGYLQVEKGGGLLLTQAGQDIAEKIYERHTLLTSVLLRMGVPEEVALRDACRMEHVISDETFDALKRIARQIETANA
ncbi:MAG: metal-dependent transcriptional regulator [Eubacteriales bacterium]|nr:metal-dependent transcriptional regulator [Eubacteriales bacterium]